MPDIDDLNKPPIRSSHPNHIRPEWGIGDSLFIVYNTEWAKDFNNFEIFNIEIGDGGDVIDIIEPFVEGGNWYIKLYCPASIDRRRDALRRHNPRELAEFNEQDYYEQMEDFTFTFLPRELCVQYPPL